MLTEAVVKQVLLALSDAGLCICEARLIDEPHPAQCDDPDWIVGRLEESGDLE